MRKSKKQPAKFSHLDALRKLVEIVYAEWPGYSTFTVSHGDRRDGSWWVATEEDKRWQVWVSVGRTAEDPLQVRRYQASPIVWNEVDRLDYAKWVAEVKARNG